VLFYNTAMIWQDPVEIIRIDHGGMSFHGGLIGVALAMLLYARLKKFAILTISDLVAPCVPIGLFFGRIANFVNNELWGRETNVPWAFAESSEDPIGRHPSQLYEAALEGIVLFIILRLATHRYGQLKRPGAVTGIFLAGYGAFRIIVETVRQPDEGWLSEWPLGLTMGMLLSLVMLIPGLWLIWKSRTAALETAPETRQSAPEPAPLPEIVSAPNVAKPKPAAKPAARKPAAKTPPKPAAKPKPKK